VECSRYGSSNGIDRYCEEDQGAKNERAVRGVSQRTEEILRAAFFGAGYLCATVGAMDDGRDDQKLSGTSLTAPQ
jgi:hypothetical protein